MLHVRQSDWQQVGGLPQPVASRVHGGVSAANAIEHCQSQTVNVIHLLSHHTATVPTSKDFYFYIFSICQYHHDGQGSISGHFLSAGCQSDSEGGISLLVEHLSKIQGAVLTWV